MLSVAIGMADFFYLCMDFAICTMDGATSLTILGIKTITGLLLGVC